MTHYARAGTRKSPIRDGISRERLAARVRVHGPSRTSSGRASTSSAPWRAQPDSEDTTWKACLIAKYGRAPSVPARTAIGGHPRAVWSTDSCRSGALTDHVTLVPKLNTRVRFSSSAPLRKAQVRGAILEPGPSSLSRSTSAAATAQQTRPPGPASRPPRRRRLCRRQMDAALSAPRSAPRAGPR